MSAIHRVSANGMVEASANGSIQMQADPLANVDLPSVNNNADESQFVPSKAQPTATMASAARPTATIGGVHLASRVNGAGSHVRGGSGAGGVSGEPTVLTRGGDFGAGSARDSGRTGGGGGVSDDHTDGKSQLSVGAASGRQAAMAAAAAAPDDDEPEFITPGAAAAAELSREAASKQQRARMADAAGTTAYAVESPASAANMPIDGAAAAAAAGASPPLGGGGNHSGRSGGSAQTGPSGTALSGGSGTRVIVAARASGSHDAYGGSVGAGGYVGVAVSPQPGMSSGGMGRPMGGDDYDFPSLRPDGGAGLAVGQYRPVGQDPQTQGAGGAVGGAAAGQHAIDMDARMTRDDDPRGAPMGGWAGGPGGAAGAAGGASNGAAGGPASPGPDGGDPQQPRVVYVRRLVAMKTDKETQGCCLFVCCAATAAGIYAALKCWADK